MQQYILNELNAHYVPHVVAWYSTEKISFDPDSNHLRSEILSLFLRDKNRASVQQAIIFRA